MPHAKVVIRTFRRPGKTGNAPQGAQSVELSGPTRQQLVGVGLMPHVPDQLILVQIKGGQKGQGQLHHAQRRRKVPTCVRNHVNDAFPHLPSQAGQLRIVQTIHLRRGSDVVQMQLVSHIRPPSASYSGQVHAKSPLPPRPVPAEPPGPSPPAASPAPGSFPAPPGADRSSCRGPHRCPRVCPR